MEQKTAPLAGEDAVETSGGSFLRIHGTQSVKPGTLLAIHNGQLLYDGEASLAPPAIMELPGLVAIMHVHDKARLDGAIKRANRAKREADKKAERLAVLHGKRDVTISPLLGAPFMPDSNPPGERDVYAEAAEKIGRDPLYGADDQGKADWGLKE